MVGYGPRITCWRLAMACVVMLSGCATAPRDTAADAVLATEPQTTPSVPAAAQPHTRPVTPGRGDRRRKNEFDDGLESPGARTRALQALETPTFSTTPQNWMAVHVIDVGQADAILLEFECAAAMIDTGLDYSAGSGAAKKLAAYLRWFFETRRPDLANTLDLVVVSHSHADHANGVRVILGEPRGSLPLKVKNALDSGYDTAAGADEQQLLRARALARQSITAAEIDWYSGATSEVIDPIGACPGSSTDPEFRALWGSWHDLEGAPDNPNHHSVVTRVDFGETSLLFTGDLQTGASEESGGLEAMLADYEEDRSVFDVDVLKVSHHGAENGTTDALMRATSPCIALVSVGDPDRHAPGSAGDHAHPRQATIERLQDREFGVHGRRPHAKVAAFPAHETPYALMDVDAAIYGTAWDGAYVLYASSAEEFWVETQRGPARHQVVCH